MKTLLWVSILALSASRVVAAASVQFYCAAMVTEATESGLVEHRPFQFELSGEDCAPPEGAGSCGIADYQVRMSSRLTEIPLENLGFELQVALERVREFGGFGLRVRLSKVGFRPSSGDAVRAAADVLTSVPRGARSIEQTIVIDDSGYVQHLACPECPRSSLFGLLKLYCAQADET